MTSVTVERIAAVQAHIAEAVTRTSVSSTVPEQEQNELLAQSCAEACDLLTDWLADSWMRSDRSLQRHPHKRPPAYPEGVRQLSGPLYRQASLARASQGGVRIPESLVDEAREKVRATARRFPRMGRQHLFRQAADRVRSLREEVCLASATRPVPDPAWRRRARKALGKVNGVLLGVTLAMAGAGPHVAAQNAAGWGQAAVRAVEVITVHYIADRASQACG